MAFAFGAYLAIRSGCRLLKVVTYDENVSTTLAGKFSCTFPVTNSSLLTQLSLKELKGTESHEDKLIRGTLTSIN